MDTVVEHNVTLQGRNPFELLERGQKPEGKERLIERFKLNILRTHWRFVREIVLSNKCV